jgi:hypothetical protein
MLAAAAAAVAATVVLDRAVAAVRKELLARAWQQQPRQPQQQCTCTAAAAPVGAVSSVRKGAHLGHGLALAGIRQRWPWQRLPQQQCRFGDTDGGSMAVGSLFPVYRLFWVVTSCPICWKMSNDAFSSIV